MTDVPLLIDIAGLVQMYGQIAGPTPQRYGLFIGEDGVDGWEDGTDMRRQSVDYAQAHGAFDAPGFLSARTASFTGSSVAETPAQAQKLKRAFMGALADGDSGLITVTQGDVCEWAWGRLGSKTKWRTDGQNPLTADIQMQLWFADPRKYGKTYSTPYGTTVSAYHDGNFKASPVITVLGDAPRYTITGPDGKAWVSLAALVPDQPHTIDMSTGTLFILGNPISGYTPQPDTWVIPADSFGVAHTISFPGGGTGQISVAVTDTSM